MRALLTTWGSRGDVEPITALAAQLLAQGAEVRVAAPPDEEFVELLAGIGVPLIPLGPTVRSVAAGEKPPSAKDALWLAPALVAARFDALGEAVEGCDVLLATGLMPAGARDVADKQGIRYICAAFHPFGIPSQHFGPGKRPGKPSPEWETDKKVLWQQDADRVDALYGPAVNSHRAKIGLSPVDNLRDYVFGDRMLLAADPTLAPWKDMTNLELVQTGAWILPDERPLPADLTAFLDAGEPPVYVGFGSMAMHSTPDAATIAVEAIRSNGRRVLISRGWANLAPGDDLDDCFTVGDTNHQALFPRVAAVIHHGGAGTTTKTALGGAPQVVVPQIADQPSWAARVVALGIGVAHDGPVPTVESLSAALATALTPEVRERATDVAAMIRTDGAETAAKLLIEGN